MHFLIPPLGLSGTPKGVPEEELKSEFNRKVGRAIIQRRRTVSEISAKNLLKMHGWVKITPLQNAKMLFSQKPIVNTMISH